MKLRALPATMVAAAVLAGPVLACGGDPMAMNLVATPSVKTALRSAYLRAHPGLPAARIGAPVAGRTYYGDRMGTRYAVATFVVGPGPAHPTIFRTDVRGRWHVLRERHGGVCADVVPIELIAIWWLERWDDRCFVLPA
jgi:hypothetical protein